MNLEKWQIATADPETPVILSRTNRRSLRAKAYFL
jgi:hypothetical protein